MKELSEELQELELMVVDADDLKEIVRCCNKAGQIYQMLLSLTQTKLQEKKSPHAKPPSSQRI